MTYLLFVMFHLHRFKLNKKTNNLISFFFNKLKKKLLSFRYLVGKSQLWVSYGFGWVTDIEIRIYS